MPYQKLWWDNLIMCEGRGRVETEQEIKGKKVRDAFMEQLPLAWGRCGLRGQIYLQQERLQWKSW